MQRRVYACICLVISVTLILLATTMECILRYCYSRSVVLGRGMIADGDDDQKPASVTPSSLVLACLVPRVLSLNSSGYLVALMVLYMALELWFEVLLTFSMTLPLNSFSSCSLLSGLRGRLNSFNNSTSEALWRTLQASSTGICLLLKVCSFYSIGSALDMDLVNNSEYAPL